MKSFLTTIAILLIVSPAWAAQSGGHHNPYDHTQIEADIVDHETRITTLESAPPPSGGLPKLVDANGTVVGTIFASSGSFTGIAGSNYGSNFYWEVFLDVPGTPRRIVVHPNYLASIDPLKIGPTPFDVDGCMGGPTIFESTTHARPIPDASFDESYNTMAVRVGSVVTVYDVPDQSGSVSLWAPESFADVDGNCTDATPAGSMPMYYLSYGGSILATFTPPFSVQ